MTAPLSVQLYSLGGAPARDPAGVIGRLAALGYEGVEPVIPSGGSDAMREWAKNMGAEDFPDIDVAALKRALDENGMTALSSHVMLPEGDRAEAVLDDLELLGTTLLVVPALFNEAAMNVELFDDLDGIKRLAERFNIAAQKAASRGIRIGYHNHFWEFAASFDGRSGMETFYDLTSPEVFAEVDIYWAQLGGRDPLDLVQTLGDRVLLLHVKDGDGQLGTPSCALGTGVVDLPAVLAAAPSALAHIVEIEGLSEDEVWSELDHSRDYLIEGGLTTSRAS